MLHDDGIELGKRTNEPENGEWFVPGGAILKHESLKAAVHQVAKTELGADVVIDRRPGVNGRRRWIYAGFPTRGTLDVPFPAPGRRFHRNVAHYLEEIGAGEPA